MKKRISSLFLALTILVSLIPMFTTASSAATSSGVASSLNEYLPIVTYAMPLSGASRVYSYSNASLRTRTTGYYIDTFSDQIVITKISADGKAVYVTYPSRSSRTGVRSRWFAAADILGLSTVSIQKYTFPAKSATYRMRSASGLTSYGSISKGDRCLLLGTRAIGGNTYCVYTYPISRGTYNKVSGVRYKLALCASAPTSTPAPSPTPAPSSSGWRMPMDNAYCTWRSYSNMSWASYTNRSGNRDYHVGLDIYGSGGKVYAAADGKVVACSSSTNTANGRYVVLQHTVSGKTVYSFYAHLASVKVYKGQTVSKGTLIGIAGGSGYGKNNYYGTHLHFAIADKLSYGGYYGYVPYFTGNKVTYKGTTYYNPLYVINNGRLP